MTRYFRKTKDKLMDHESPQDQILDLAQAKGSVGQKVQPSVIEDGFSLGDTSAQEVPQKLPKPVVAAREKLAGVEITKDTLFRFLAKSELNVLASNMRNTMLPEAKEKYGRLKSDSDRRAWLAQYVIDPKTTTNMGFNSTTTYNEEVKVGKTLWLHESEIAGSKFLNDPEMARIICNSGELEARPSEHTALAEKGYKQYYFCKEELKKYTGVREEAGVQAEAQLRDDEYAEVQADMVGNFGKSATRKRPAPKAPESEEKKTKREMTNYRATMMRKCKQLIDKTTNEVVMLEGDLLKLKEKGYPDQMLHWCKEKFKVLSKHTKEAQDIYNEEVLKVNANNQGAIGLEADARRVDNAVQALEAHYSTWKKTSGSEIRKLMS